MRIVSRSTSRTCRCPRSRLPVVSLLRSCHLRLENPRKKTGQLRLHAVHDDRKRAVLSHRNSADHGRQHRISRRRRSRARRRDRNLQSPRHGRRKRPDLVRHGRRKNPDLARHGRRKSPDLARHGRRKSRDLPRHGRRKSRDLPRHGRRKSRDLPRHGRRKSPDLAHRQSRSGPQRGSDLKNLFPRARRSPPKPISIRTTGRFRKHEPARHC
jgi:hypothetical protein